VEAGQRPPASVEQLTAFERASERLMLGLRLDRPLAVDGLADVIDPAELDRMRRAGLVEASGSTISLSERGRFMANDVLSTILR
jgi:oxygen-independent coproporphyrinogen-3 oxidase